MMEGLASVIGEEKISRSGCVFFTILVERNRALNAATIGDSPVRLLGRIA